MGLIQRQAARRAVDVARLALVGAVGEGARDLLAGDALLARDLGVRGAIRHAFGEPRAEASRDPLARRQLLVRLGQRTPTVAAAVAALAPHQPRQLPGDRQVAHPHARALLDAHIDTPTVGARGGAREQLDLQVELLATRATPVTTNPSSPTRRVA